MHDRIHIGLKIFLFAVVFSHCYSCSEATILRENTEHSAMVEDNRIQGEYILTVDESEKPDDETIRMLFKDNLLQKIRRLGGGRILIKVKDDPGPDLMKQKVLESNLIKQIQPNYRYYYHTPKK